jgi:methylmalonyl-CoA mutase N-terminal domain/subunit
MHTNSLDEAYALPSEAAIKLAVRTQQIILHESGVADVVDPLGGSYYVETLTRKVEEGALQLIERIDSLGGLIAAIESGFVAQTIAQSSWDQQMAVESGERIVVGVNEYVDDDRSTAGIELFEVDPEARERQLQRLKRVKRERESARAKQALRELEARAPHLEANLMPNIEEAVRARCTIGEICDVLRSVWGEHRPPTAF